MLAAFLSGMPIQIQFSSTYYVATSYLRCQCKLHGEPDHPSMVDGQGGAVGTAVYLSHEWMHGLPLALQGLELVVECLGDLLTQH